MKNLGRITVGSVFAFVAMGCSLQQLDPINEGNAGAKTDGGNAGESAAGVPTGKGGAFAKGGTSSKGGETSTSSRSTDAAGATSQGGLSNAGGSSNQIGGGATTTGGSSTNNGGTVATGGSTTAGGASASGGATAKGGSSSTGGSSATGGTTATNWCSSQTMPADVVASDYQCVDFDGGMPATSTWTQLLVNGGALALSTSRASSSPNSLLATAPANTATTPATANMTFKGVGATAIKSVSVAADISTVTQTGVVTPWDGSVAVLCLSTGSGRACLRYTYNGTTQFQSSYTGYFLETLYTVGAAMRSETIVPGTITANLWSRVTLRLILGTSSTSIEVLFNGVSQGTYTGKFNADTVANVTVGEQISSTTSYAYNLYYDNIVAAIGR